MKVELCKLLKLIDSADKKLRVNYGSTLDAPLLGQLRGALNKLFKFPTRDAAWAADHIINQYMGRSFSKDILVSVVCRIFSYRGMLWAGVPPPLWDGYKYYTVMLCTGVSQALEAKKPSLKVHMKCLIGDPAGLDFTVTLSRAYMEYLLGKELGLSYRSYNASAEYFTGCFFKCLVEEDNTGPRVAEITATAKMKELNKKKADARLSLSKCDTPQLDCAFCKKTKKDCPLAVWK